MKRKSAFIVIVLIALLVGAFIAVPRIQVNALTSQHAAEFEDRYKDIGYYEDIEYFKVIKYKGEGIDLYVSSPGMREKLQAMGDDEAAVLYVDRNSASASILIFKENPSGDWEMDTWFTVWSKSGSADEFTWPMYR